MRSKGFFWIATRPFERGLWSQAGAITSLSRAGFWFADLPEEQWPVDAEAKAFIKKDFAEGVGDKRNEIVCIGTFEAGDKERLTAALDRCLVSDAEFEEYKRKERQAASMYQYLARAAQP